MNLLIVGSGGREHALAWKLAQSPRVSKIFTAPGNAGTASLGENLAIDPLDFRGLAEAVDHHHVDLTVVGPEAPLAEGIVDFFQERALPVFGPPKAAARIESSKSFARSLMEAAGVPCARGQSFTSFEEAKAFIRSLPKPPVIKADGLAAGKGVTVAANHEEAFSALEDAMVRGVFGDAGRRVVIEERLTGREASAFVFTDGVTVLPTIPARDYKRIRDGDKGPNTGGMGSYSPPEFLDDDLVEKVTATVFQPVLKVLSDAGTPYRGLLYAGLMIENGEPKVIEFNCRMGDPETQVILPRLESDLLDIIEGVVAGKLDGITPEWKQEACVGVVMASRGYPGQYQTGKPITGLDRIPPEAVVFHSGTRLEGGLAVTAGGRVLTVTALGPDLESARRRAYSALRHINFEGSVFRNDIATLSLPPRP